MSLLVKDKGSEFVQAPEGLHIARCYAVIDLGRQFNARFNNYSAKVLIGWELMDAFLADGKPFIQFQRYTASLTETSHLRKLLESWRGKGFTTEELEGFHLQQILGVPCYLTTKPSINATTQQRWSEVIGICKLPDGVVCPAPFNAPLYFDLDDYSDEAYAALPEGIRKKINLDDIKPASDGHTGTTSMDTLG